MDSPVKKPAGPKLLQKSLDDYYFARLEEKAQQYAHIFENLAYVPSTEIAAARRDIACLDGQLVRARDKWAGQKKILNERWITTKERYDKLYSSFPRLNGYFKDSFAKRERSEQAEFRERRQIEDKNREIRKLKKEVSRLREVKDEVASRHVKFSAFEIYLKNVKDSSQGEYENIRDIIDRYNVLAEARSGLTKRTDKMRETIQVRQKRMESDVVTKSMEVLTYRNYLSELIQYHDQLQDQVRTLDDSLLRIKTTAAQRTLIIGQIKMAIQNLYFQVCKHMHRAARLAPDDTLGQLSDIKISVVEMFKLSRDIKHMLKAAFVAAEAERVSKEKARKTFEETQHKAVLKVTMPVKTGNDHSDMRAAFGITAKILAQAKKKNKHDLEKFLGHFLNEETHHDHHNHHFHHHHHEDHGSQQVHDSMNEPHYAVS